jgi:ribosomal protein S18 acetylase RimI-like enzyme
LGHFIVYGFFKYGTIDELFVKKEFQNKGIATGLMKAIMKKFKNFKAKIVLVGTEKENKEAIKLYKKLGFELAKKALWFYWRPKNL